MFQKPLELIISVGAGPEADEIELEELTRLLSDELAELNAVTPNRIQNPYKKEGAKGISVDIGTILVKIAEVGGISEVIAILRHWLSRDERRTIVLQIGANRLEVAGISKYDQLELIKWFQIQTGLRIQS